MSSVATSATVETRNWLELPEDVTAKILKKLGAIEILSSAKGVCATWRKICKDASMWRRIDMRRNHGDDIHIDLEMMCRYAVDLSDGQLIDINLEFFGTNQLLHYIAHRSSRLKRLRLVACDGISNEGLINAAGKLPLLEVLDVTHSPFSKAALEAVGRSCPYLKTLKFNSQVYQYQEIECDEHAIAIAGNMPGLRHLQLFGNQLTDDGLQAILNGCPLLESLDLRRCYNVFRKDDSNNLAKTCAKQIKALRLPHDSTDDYEFDAGDADSWSFDEDDYPCGCGLSDIELELVSEDEYIYEFSSDEYIYEFSSDGGVSEDDVF
ncbi:hypothetical protein ACFE04_030088 [Oxalis oulophora]